MRLHRHSRSTNSRPQQQLRQVRYRPRQRRPGRAHHHRKRSCQWAMSHTSALLNCTPIYPTRSPRAHRRMALRPFEVGCTLPAGRTMHVLQARRHSSEYRWGRCHSRGGRAVHKAQLRRQQRLRTEADSKTWGGRGAQAGTGGDGSGRVGGGGAGGTSAGGC